MNNSQLMSQHSFELYIHRDVLQRFPSLRVLAMTVSGFQKIASDHVPPAAIQLSDEQRHAPVTEIPQIAAWRETYRKMGLRASKYHSSIESLYRRAIKGPQAWRVGVAAVDFYNGLSLQYIAPLGAYDLDTITGGVVAVRFMDTECDTFTPLGSERRYPMSADIAGYASGNDILCWGLNHRDSRQYCLCENTNNVLFISEAVSDLQFSSSMSATLELWRRCEAFGADCSTLRLHDEQFPKGRPLQL